jgi:transglutaminase-like putative cysteine protease
MNKFVPAIVCAWVIALAPCPAQTDPASEASRLEVAGHFREATAILTNGIADQTLTGFERKKLRFELDRLDRIKKDFPFTTDSLFAELKDSVAGLTREEYDGWVKEGRFDSRDFDGERRFTAFSVNNLFFRYPELAPRRTPAEDTAPLQKARLESVTAIRKAALAAKQPYVLPKKFHVTMKVTAEAGAAPAGEVIRAWLPIPRDNAFQSGFDLISSSPTVKHVDVKDSPIRSVCAEQTVTNDQPTRFRIEYEYTIHAVSFDVKPADVRPCNTNDPALKPYLAEAPHVTFTPELRALSQKIVGDETNTCLKAKKCFDWISENIKYSYAIEYSTIRNISDYCRSKGYGDCGQEAMLFIALCRLNGIPARWQTGWNTFPNDNDIHDWSEIYLEPYGWMPADPYMGIFAMQYANTLTPEQRRQIRDFYFGGLDQYRMIANSDHSQTLTPPKRSMRSDDVDFQRGELECGDKNIYFDDYSYSFNVKEISPRAD